MKSSKPNAKPFWRALLILYSLFMLWLLFGRSAGGIEGLSYQEQLGYNRNLKPFFTIGNYLWVVFHSSNAYLVRHCFINLAGNVLLFIPVGFLFVIGRFPVIEWEKRPLCKLTFDSSSILFLLCSLTN